MPQPQQSLKLILLLIFQFALTSCVFTGTPRTLMYSQAFSFNTEIDTEVYGKPEIDVLDYAYGDIGISGTRPSKEEREKSNTFSFTDVSGLMPRANFLYVKWRIKQTGQVYEDKVDLRNHIPNSIQEGYRIHFAIRGSQLYVYLFPERTAILLPTNTPPDHIFQSDYAKQHQIYPGPMK